MHHRHAAPGRADPRTLFSRELPKDLDSEAATLGSILLMPDRFDDIAHLLQPSDFFDPANQTLFRHLQQLRAQDGRIDITLLCSRLKKHGEFELAGGAAHLARVSSSVPTAAHAVYYAKQVLEFSKLRQLIDRGTAIVSDAYEQATDADHQVGLAEQRILEIRDQRQPMNLRLVHQSMSDALMELERRLTGDLPETAGTGFSDLDDMLCGLKPGQLIVLAARPSMGKTALALNIAEHTALDQGLVTLFISLEMSEMELADRMLGAAARVSGHRMRAGILREKELQALVEAAARFHQVPLHVEDSTALRVSDIAAHVRRLAKRASNGKVGLVIIDYLQLLESDNAKDPRHEQVAQTTRRLKQLAKDAHCPVLCLCQLNRQVEGSSDHRPRLNHLRESGSIEQDADLVLFVHRPEYYLTGQEKEDHKGQAEIIVAKHRNGPTGIVEVVWLEEITRFENRAATWHETAAAAMPQRDPGFDQWNQS